MKLRNIQNLFFLLITVFAASCNPDSSNNGGSKSHLPIARGEANAILCVMDTSQWNGAVGEALRDIFSDYVPGLPQDEAYFKLRNINPLKMNNILKTGKSMIFVSTMDNQGAQSRAMQNYFTSSSLERILQDTSLYRLPQKNQFARGQEILHLFGQTEGQLIAHLKRDKDVLRNYFLNIENERIAKAIFKVREKQIEKTLRETHGFDFQVPYGYDLAKNQRDFIWVRLLDPEYEKDVFVHYRPFTSRDPFEDVLAFREEITSSYMRDIQKPDIFMTLQNENMNIREVNFKGKYAKELRGLWKLSDISSGGPFVSYLFVDESQKRLYYLEGYVYAPSKDKREFMQEIEVILNTFRSGEELK
ncbi:protein of unknown function [Reichenbachiella faecimaris]|uniref:DUF4837 domain-containing protein n=1 Tax=Reichenbachiella faecimaris TaxID=692418 RepID=A0A1W2GER2_REIFA|nr:DUF4837 family protein [Reichenbachiella faecimaris]SMD34982.1 protein of unknown function [Reichenbachiella faecimaris]